MKTMKTMFLAGLVAVGLVLPAAAQTTFPIKLGTGVQSAAHAIAEDGDTAMFCKYIGTAACAKIAVAAGGDLTFTEGTCGSEAATSTFECPVSGALGGVIDVSDTACDTFGEVVDTVNAASTGWRCQLYEALRSDSSNDTLVTISATAATDPGGLGLKVDSSVALFSTIAVAPPAPGGQTMGYQFLAPGPLSTSFLTNPWANTQGLLTAFTETTTFVSGTSLVSVIGVKRNFASAGSESTITLWPSTAGGATTVEKVFGSCFTSATGCNTAWGNGGLFAPPGYQMLVRVTNDTALSANTLAVNGYLFNNSGVGLNGGN